MKIIVHNQENNISLRLPGWLLVDITTHKGDIVKITL